jgi:lactoylglutathione lyase
MSATDAIATLQRGHVGLNVTDLDRSTSFYARLFGLEVLSESVEGDHRYAFLGSEGSVLLTLWQQSDGQFATDLPGLHHLSFQVADIDAVRRAEATLQELGTRFAYDGIVRHREGDESAGVFFQDPDGIRLEIYASTGAGTAPAPTHSDPACGFF